MARALGRRGGRARAQNLPAAERQRIAALGGQARRRSLEMAMRLDANFAYVAAIDELRGPRPALDRMPSFDGPLPGLYVERDKP
jgi:hypothetical protein